MAIFKTLKNSKKKSPPARSRAKKQPKITYKKQPNFKNFSKQIFFCFLIFFYTIYIRKKAADATAQAGAAG